MHNFLHYSVNRETNAGQYTVVVKFLDIAINKKSSSDEAYLIRSCTSLDVIGEPNSFKIHFSSTPRLVIVSDPVHSAPVVLVMIGIYDIIKKLAAASSFHSLFKAAISIITF